jgi:prefoldin subunit 5
VLGFGKGAKVSNQIDAEVKGAKVILQNAIQTTKSEFDLVEEQLQQLANLANGDQVTMMFLNNIKNQINASQGKILQNLTAVDSSLTKIDQYTDAFQ